uniref:SH2 domain containing 4B n=1 Tax=Petromyzon marinus TaxID=7757 RepID=S4RFF6_PETMA
KRQWGEQLKKAKAADEARRQLVLRTREEYKRQSIRAIEKGSVASLTNRFVGIDVQDCHDYDACLHCFLPKPILFLKVATSSRHSKKPELACPTSRQAIVTWFREREIPRRACFRGNTDTVAPWFHGIISREDAEELLSGTAEGTFLLRVSERVWGYALSYRMARSTKHFLVDAAGDSYSFFGVDQMKHASLPELVNFHTVEPVTVIGGEILKTPCGQPKGKLPDYGNLFS